MTVDLRAIIACDLGPIIGGSVGSNHISDRSGLQMVTGRLTMDGLYSPARGTAINLLVACSQNNRITRFPKVLRVIRSTAYPQDNRTEIEVGCKLTLYRDRKDQQQFFPTSGPISAGSVLNTCLQQLGLTMASSSASLSAQLLSSSVDLSRGYIQVMGDLIRSERAFGRLRPDESFEVVPLQFGTSQKGPVLTTDDLVSIEPISGGGEPPDRFTVSYRAVERPAGSNITTQQATQLAADYWTSSETVAPPEVVKVNYISLGGVDTEYTYTKRSRSASELRYITFSYTDADGKQQRVEILDRKIDTKYATAASLNNNLLIDALRHGKQAEAGLFSDAATTEESVYDYKTSSDGPVKLSETTTRYASQVEFAGAIGIKSYIESDGFSGYSWFYMPSVASKVPVAMTRTTYETFTDGKGRTTTRTLTSRWLSRGLTQQGQHEFSLALKNTASDAVSNLVAKFSELSFEGTEIQTEVGKPSIPTRPSEQDRLARAISSDATVDKTVSGIVAFTAGQPSDNITTTATYDMPYCPDDWASGGIALLAAQQFGQGEAAIDVGHAHGFNIVTSFDRVPTLDLAPIYIRHAGIEAAFLTDSLSYAFDAAGIVVSSDLMLLGVTGYYGAAPPATSWIQLPVATSSLQPASAVTVETSPAKANSVAYPSGFNPLNPAATFAAIGSTGSDVFPIWKQGQHLIGPTVAVETETLTTGSAISAIEYDYPLVLPVDIAALATGGFAQSTPPSIANGTAAPILGATQVSPTTAATGNGWTLVFDGTADDNSTSISGFGFAFTLNETAYTGCAVSSNSYITFGGSQDVYQNLSASNPSLPKLLIAAGDFSYQRIYTKAVAGAFRIRYEGNSNRSASAGNSDRFLEVTFYEALESGAQLLEVRSGNVGGNLSGPFMLATASTELASEVFAENESWVFQGNAAGTTWSVQSAKHVTGAAS